ncbi:heavy metal translocating P-type ATPase [Silvimonas sp. JCM 19000]
MTATTTIQTSPAPTSAEAACFHCNEPVPPNLNLTIRYRETHQPACCAGCQAVAQSIIDAGLGDYYEQRERPADRAAPLPDELLARLRLYDDPALQQGFVSNAGTDEREAALLIEGITCSACIWLNERQIGKVPGVLGVSINYTTHRARVRWDERTTRLSSILQAISAIGYRAQPYDRARQEAASEKSRKTALLRLWVAGLSMMQVMMFTVPVYLSDSGDIAPQWMSLLNWATFLMTLPVATWASWPFYVSSWRDLKRGRAGMDLPVSIGVLSAFAASTLSLLHGQREVYFDSVSMFVFLLLSGRYLEERARRRAGAALEQLAGLLPAFAHRVLPDQTTEEVAVIHLQMGDTVLVKPGETIPVDGEILSGASEVDEALLTGESQPLAKHLGDSVTAGTVNHGSPLQISASRVGQSTRLSGIVRLLDRALAEKPRAALLADRIAGVFVAALLLVAAGTWWYWHGHNPAHALPITIAVLVISCPCALSLATPAALTAATGQLARRGMLIARGHTLDALANITDVVFDKTGTLTHGQPQRVQQHSWHGDATKLLQVAAALEAHSSHPLAHAFADLDAAAALTAQDVVYHAGGGLTGVVDGLTWALGHADFVAQNSGLELPADAPVVVGTPVWLAGPGGIARFDLADTARADAASTVAALQQAGLSTHLLSGDHPAPVQALAQQLGIAHAQAQASPEGKLAAIRQLQSQGKRVLMVGDGVNDAPVLALSDASIVMGSGVDVAQTVGDAVLYDCQLAHIPYAIRLARQTRTVIRQNLWWALAYNLVALPLAMAGYVTPWLASLGMACSSLLVVGNALRLAGSRHNGRKPGVK